MLIRFAGTPDVLWRIGRAPDPLVWPPRAFVGGGRFDHPTGDFLVLYCAEQRRGAFLETLESFRPAITDLAQARRLPEGDTEDHVSPIALIPESYFRKTIGRLRPAAGQQWLDLRSPETHQELRSELAGVLVSLGYAGRFVWGDLLRRDHGLTQAIGLWAYERSYHGIVYASCHDAAVSCWAMFDRADFQPIGPPQPIMHDDQDLITVAHLFGLVVP